MKPQAFNYDDFIELKAENEKLKKEIADAETVKHGHWIISCDGYYPYCSNCKKEPESRIMTDFCPKCGTKMDEEEK